MRTKISYGDKVISFTEGDKIEIECKDHKMLENIVLETAATLEEKTVTITENGTTEITQGNGYDGFSKVTVEVDVPIPDGYIVPSGALNITENGTHDVTNYAGVTVNVEGEKGYITVSSEAELPTDVPDGTIAIVG